MHRRLDFLLVREPRDRTTEHINLGRRSCQKIEKQTRLRRRRQGIDRVHHAGFFVFWQGNTAGPTYRDRLAYRALDESRAERGVADWSDREPRQTPGGRDAREKDELRPQRARAFFS